MVYTQTIANKQNMNGTDDLTRLVDGLDYKPHQHEDHHHHYDASPSKHPSSYKNDPTITISVSKLVFLFLGTMLLGGAIPIIFWETNRQYNDGHVLAASQTVIVAPPNNGEMYAINHNDPMPTNAEANDDLTTMAQHSYQQPVVVVSNESNSTTMNASMTTTTTITMTATMTSHNTVIPSRSNIDSRSSRTPKRSPGDAPGIAWLMSFPNSGTSFTMNLVTAASNLSQASNYGWERSSTSTNLQVFSGGPYWLQTDWIIPNTTTNPVVLTKTHCGGYCHDCHIRKQIESPHSFLMHCAMSDDFVEDPVEDTIEDNDVPHENVVGDGSNHKHNRTFYDYQQVVDRAVHLFRNPLDNIVSRYHLGIHKVVKENNSDLIERYTYDRQGFESFCMDKMDYWDERRDSHVDQSILRMVWEVPCHMDLFRYVQWHNLAFIATDDFLQIPVHTVYYEDYNDSASFNETLNSLLNFLDLPNTGGLAEFEPGKSYREYYTDKQFDAMRNATMKLASAKTWKHLERYF